MRIVFHIGMGKTGTSSIQYVLENNPEELAKQNAAYLGIWFDAIDPSFKGQEGFARFLAQKNEEMAASADKFHAYLVDRAAKDGIETFILSNEGLYEAGRQLNPFFSTLKLKGMSMSLVAYLPDPRAWLPSAYTQWAIRHKTNEGPIRDFPTAARHLIGRYEEFRFWQQEFGDALTVRPFETGSDVVQDFATTVGITLPPTNTRELERAEPADILLRAMFNSLFTDPVLPERFDRVVINSSNVPVPSLREMAARCFDYEDAEKIIVENRKLFEFIRDDIGIDLLGGEPRAMKSPGEAELQSRVTDYLVQVTFDQAQRIKRLERLVNELKDQQGS